MREAAWITGFCLIVASISLVACKPADQTSGEKSAGTSDSSLRTNAENANNYVAPANESDPTRPGSNWQPPDDHKAATFAGMTTAKPATWVEHPSTSSIVSTRFNVPGKNDNPAAEISVYENIGGSIDDNISRWRGQFRTKDDGSLIEPTITEFTTQGNFPVTLVELTGDYAGMTATYKADQHFMMAIIEGPAGLVFVRFVGSEMTVMANRDAFLNMIKGLREQA